MSDNPINPSTLKRCRKQMALTIEEAQEKAKLKSLDDIENGKKTATINQIQKLADVYLVPAWVLAEPALPDEHDFTKTTASFRTFKKAQGDNFNYTLIHLTKRIEELRDEIISLKEDMEAPIPKFIPPKTTLTKRTVETASRSTRKWLGIGNEHLKFSQWRERLEDKGVFVFVTNQFNHWSRTDPTIFRGLSIYHERLPIIIINGSDTYKARSFTLFHELGHLLMKDTAIDVSFGDSTNNKESICDEFAGNILMPTDLIIEKGKKIKQNATLEKIETISKKFKTSIYATLVRLSNLGMIHKKKYKELEASLLRKIRNTQELKKSSTSKIARDMAQEAWTQYGRIYSTTVTQAYFNDHITLHTTRNMFEFKNTDHVLKMISNLK